MHELIISPVAYFRSPLKSKFGIPRQSGVVESVTGRIVFTKEYSGKEAVRGLEQFDYLWLIWGFSANKHKAKGLTVRPPRLGGNEHLGVFATRSPFRPNPVGLSSVRIVGITTDDDGLTNILVKGADLMDCTPIYDIKPYVAYADCHEGAKSGFTDSTNWGVLKVVMPQSVSETVGEENAKTICELLSQDPRPQYHDDANRVYGMLYADWDIKFSVSDGVVKVVEAKKDF